FVTLRIQSAKGGAALQLLGDGRVGDFVVGREQHGFAEDEGERAIAFEWQKGLPRLRLSACRYDAEIPVIRRHEDVPAAEVDFVGVQFAPNEEEFVFEGTLCCDL